MANIEVKLRRGTTAQHSTFKGAEGEVTVDTDKDTVVVHDGTTNGGHELRRKDDTIASSEISSTDTTLNVNDTNNNIGTGALAVASFQLTVDGGTGKNTIYAKGDKTSAYVDLSLENESTTGNGGRMRITQGINAASFQYQETGERAALTIVDGSLSANAGITVACSSATQAAVQPSGSMYSLSLIHI